MTIWIITGMLVIILGDMYIQWCNSELIRKEGKWISSLLKEQDLNFNKPKRYYSYVLKYYNMTQKARFLYHVKRELAIRSYYQLADYYKNGGWAKHHKLR